MNTHAVSPMKQIRIEKVTVNMGVGKVGEEHKRAMTLCKKLQALSPCKHFVK